MPISDKCCDKLKKEPLRRKVKELGMKCVILGILASESYQREKAWLEYGCNVFYQFKDNQCKPLSFWTDDDINEYIEKYNVKIAYINQSDYGRWIINNYAHLSDTDKRTFRKGINEVLPYIADRELFISHIKYSMKSDICRNLAYDCVMEDCMHMDNSPSILRKDGFEFLYDKYKDKIYKDMEQIAKDWGLDVQKEVMHSENSNEPDRSISLTAELPFDTAKED